MADLLSLPVELVCRVAEFMPPSSHLDFACTCSHLKASLRDILRRHHRAHHHGRVSSDVLPSSVPELLRAVIADPIVAWHVREVEWWTNRAKWEDWRPLKLVREGEGDRERYQDVEPLEWSFRQGEVELLLSVAEPYVRNYHMGSEMHEETRDEIIAGDDGFMKLLILLLCPRLDSVKYIRGSFVPRQSQSRGPVGNSSLAWLCLIIWYYSNQAKVLWPPGLQTLRSIAIGVESGTWLDGEEGRDDKYHQVVFARLLNLPGLDSIFFRAIDENADFPVEHEYKFAEGCSSVRQIFLDEISYNDPVFWMRTMKACKNELTHVALRASSQLDVESTIGHAQNIVPEIQSVILYAPEPWNPSYYRLEELVGYYPTDGKNGLRQISTTIEDIIFNTGDHDIWIQTNGVQGVSRVTVMESLAPQYIMPCFPRTMEVLVIAGNFDDLCREIPPDEMAKWFDEGLAAMISCKNIYEAAEIVEEERVKFEELYEKDFARRLADHVEGEVLLTREVENYYRRARQPVAISEDEYAWPNLKAIYIDPCVLREEDGLSVAPKTHLWLQKAIKAGAKRGVDVRTRTNVNPPIHRDIFLLTPPNPMALQSSPRRNTNLEDCVFDVFSGQWTTRGCNNCARCDDCHGLFSGELWDEAYRTPEDAQVR